MAAKAVRHGDRSAKSSARYEGVPQISRKSSPVVVQAKVIGALPKADAAAVTPELLPKNLTFCIRSGCAAPSWRLPEILTAHCAEKKKSMDSVTYPHVRQAGEGDIGSRIPSPQIETPDSGICEFAEKNLLNILTHTG
ncbi:hypothetical protein AB4Y43_16205 [Paraburkholderia sp. BR10872]|uniref:hypothetical protein n=1 Tax=Paraburkholderia sp. BR10872 TaxID=3236989 RepID=UPI0034D1B030